MNGLLREVLAARGGIDRWKRYGKISATIVSGGDLFDAKGLKPDMTPRKVSTATKVERMIATPFGNPNWKMTFVPDRVVIEDGNGAVVAERSNPSHSSNQDFYFGPDFLLRRHDYQVDIAGSFPAAQYVYDLQEFAGFWFPTKRRAHPRNADLTAEKHRTYVWIDVAEVAVGEED